MSLFSSNLTVEPVFKDGVTVVFSADQGYVPYLATTLASVISHSSPSRSYDLVILHTGIGEGDQLKIKSQAQGRDHISLRFFDMADSIAENSGHLFVNAHLSVATYYRLFTPSIFVNYDKILYLDADLVLLDDVARIFETNLGDNILGAVRDYYAICDLMAAPKSEWAGQVGLNDCSNYFNAGVILLNLAQIRHDLIMDKWQAYLARVRQPRLHDQDVLNSCSEGRVTWLHPGWNNHAWNEYLMGVVGPAHLTPSLEAQYQSSKVEPKIIHYVSKHKPWAWPHLPLAEYFWQYALSTPYYPQLSWPLICRLSAVVDSQIGQGPWNAPALKYHLYRLAAALTTGRRKARFLERAMKYKMRLDFWAKVQGRL